MTCARKAKLGFEVRVTTLQPVSETLCLPQTKAVMTKLGNCLKRCADLDIFQQVKFRREDLRKSGRALGRKRGPVPTRKSPRILGKNRNPWEFRTSDVNFPQGNIETKIFQKTDTMVGEVGGSIRRREFLFSSIETQRTNCFFQSPCNESCQRLLHSGRNISQQVLLRTAQ